MDTSLRSKIKQLAQVKQDAAEDCDVEAPELGDLSGDLLDWCPEEFGANGGSLGAAILTSGFNTASLTQNLAVASTPDTMQNTTV